jgi:hypothetical protein
VKRTFRFHASLGKSGLADALVTFAGRRFRTGKRGNAQVALRFAHAGKRGATLTVDGRVVARTAVTVSPTPPDRSGDPD